MIVNAVTALHRVVESSVVVVDPSCTDSVRFRLPLPEEEKLFVAEWDRVHQNPNPRGDTEAKLAPKKVQPSAPQNSWNSLEPPGI